MHCKCIAVCAGVGYVFVLSHNWSPINTFMCYKCWIAVLLFRKAFSGDILAQGWNTHLWTKNQKYNFICPGWSWRRPHCCTTPWTSIAVLLDSQCLSPLWVLNIVEAFIILCVRYTWISSFILESKPFYRGERNEIALCQTWVIFPIIWPGWNNGKDDFLGICQSLVALVTR